ncbi:MAG TPA: hypothetical protein VMT47_03650, partial [Polyangia bacterium]|nr:hypothetical protein [Polyangia bacterium]
AAARPADACGFLLAAGDIRGGKLGDPEGAKALYARAAAVAPRDSRLATRMSGALATTVAHDITDEMIL